MIIPTIWKNKQCSKPPTRIGMERIKPRIFQHTLGFDQPTHDPQSRLGIRWVFFPSYRWFFRSHLGYAFMDLKQMSKILISQSLLPKKQCFFGMSTTTSYNLQAQSSARLAHLSCNIVVFEGPSGFSEQFNWKLHNGTLFAKDLPTISLAETKKGIFLELNQHEWRYPLVN